MVTRKFNGKTFKSIGRLRAPIDKVPVTGQYRVQVVRGDTFITKRTFRLKKDASKWKKKALAFFKK
jgi:hypothetical protein